MTSYLVGGQSVMLRKWGYFWIMQKILLSSRPISGLAAIFPGVVVGAIAGGVVGAAGFRLFGIGTSEEGFIFSAIFGGIGGGFFFGGGVFCRKYEFFILE